MKETTSTQYEFTLPSGLVMSLTNIPASDAQAIEDGLNGMAKLRAEFEAYREGSEEAFGAVVEQKNYLAEKAARQFETIQMQGQIIARMRTQLQEKGLTV